MRPRDLVAPFVETRLGFPRVDWARAAVAIGVDGAVPRATWDELVVGWLEHMVDARPGSRMSRAANFLLVELPADERAQHALRWADEARDFLLRNLDGIAAPHASPLPLLLFARGEDYIDYYLGDTAIDAELELASTGGVLIDGPCPHVAAPFGTELESTLVHELAHAFVQHLPMPQWLSQCIAQAMQRQWTQQSPGMTHDEILEQRRRWNGDTIQSFWSGFAFFAPGLQQVAFSLALTLATRLAGNYDRLCAFANEALAEDAGAAAFATIYGEPIERLLEPLLGPGPWQPDPTRW
jgi:hypothetical protein